MLPEEKEDLVKQFDRSHARINLWLEMTIDRYPDKSKTQLMIMRGQAAKDYVSMGAYSKLTVLYEQYTVMRELKGL